MPARFVSTAFVPLKAQLEEELSRISQAFQRQEETRGNLHEDRNEG
jgi:hypothetical protein